MSLPPGPRFRRGMTILELIYALAIFLLVITSVFQLSILIGAMDRDTRVESRLYVQGQRILDRIERGSDGLGGLMKARSGSVNVSADKRTLDFTLDKNVSYTEDEGDDTGVRVYFDNGDGSDVTLEDNAVVLDPDTAMVGDEIVLGREVETLQFDVSAAGVVTAEVELGHDKEGAVYRVDMNRKIFLRN